MSATQKADRSDRVSELEAERNAALARAERAEEALRPFAEIAEDDLAGTGFMGRDDSTAVVYCHLSEREITMGDLRRARAVLTRPEAEEGESRHGA